ncbi:hypothetical protein AB0J85_03295 [Micromonospora echinofusca]|uniref:Flavin reductase n=1 Tax=Micromonospora echinofusca TaxID=47858 RepID=A0A1C5GG09_MICEH|nr:hypothetical protein [Micromonospora echinofusca]SCG18512.1 hypothetical protein GA0070610_4857 [Micromonospora echinofusca]
MTGGAESSASGSDEHAPLAPGWTCGTCGADWPCVVKRSRLLEEYRTDRAMLSVYLGSCLAAAAQDLPATPGASLQDRFIGWLPRTPRVF